jgi:carbonic anhydrase
MQESIDPALAKLFEGIKGFKQRFYQQEPDRMRGLVEHGQRPEVLLIACSDSRVDPALLTGAAPGELFVLRNVANLVPPYQKMQAWAGYMDVLKRDLANPVPSYQQDGKYDGARAAIEYAVRDLEVRHIIVLGHAHCGGINALLSTVAGCKPPRDFIGDWVSIAMDACCNYILNPLSGDGDGQGQETREIDIDSLREHQHLVERAAIRGSLANLATYPWLKERLDAGQLSLHGWWFDLETGDLWTTDAGNTCFLPVLD